MASETPYGGCRLLGKTGVMEITVQVIVSPWSDAGHEGRFRELRAIYEMHGLIQGIRKGSLRKRCWHKNLKNEWS